MKRHKPSPAPTVSLTQKTTTSDNPSMNTRQFNSIEQRSADVSSAKAQSGSCNDDRRAGRPHHFALIVLTISVLTIPCCNNSQSQRPPRHEAKAKLPLAVRYVDVTRKAGIHFIHDN